MGRRVVLLILEAALFVGSALLFLVEPMFAKMVLPLLGGSSAVWITSLVFFQATLLAGYAYSHGSTSRLGPRRQSLAHLGVMVLPLLVLPIAIPSGWIPPSTGNPVLWLLALLAVAVGLPFFVVSSTAPLVQRWFSASSHPAASDPYFLYRASNLGSMIGLLAYPLVVERVLPLGDQAQAWTIGYWVLVGVTAGCVILLRRSPAVVNAEHAAPVRADGLATPARAGRPVARRRLRWVALAFVPSSLMLGVTAYITTDIAPIPLLWVIPLALYLLSFILVFAPRYPRFHRLVVRALPLLVLPLVLVIGLRAVRPLWVLLPLHLLTFLVAAMVCHGELARDRPSPRYLTEFYLWIAVGGVLGGVFNALAAPVLFNTLVEYPLALILACPFRPIVEGRRTSRGDLWLDLALPAALGALMVAIAYAVRSQDLSQEVLRRGLLFGLPAILCFTFADRPIRFGLGVGAIVLVGGMTFGSHEHAVYEDRSFYGAYRVVDDTGSGLRLFYHGDTVHGAQSLDPSHRLDPLTYYTHDGPVGQVFDAVAPALEGGEVGVVGLGVGSLACYSEPGQGWTFYEIDPTVERIAEARFSFLGGCPVRPDVVVGDGRLQVARAPASHFDLLVLDAFNSDSVPIHLLTREAITLYLSKLTDHGVLLFNISNQYLDLRPVLAAEARDAGLVCYARDDVSISPDRAAGGALSSSWIVMARSDADLRGLTEEAGWYSPAGVPGAAWTDDFSNVFSTFRWS